MSSYNFETVDYDRKYPANIFATHIGYSKFHWHYEYELCLVLKGKVRLTYDSQTLVYKEKDIVLINSKVVHSVQSEEDNLCIFIQLDPVLFQDSISNTESVRYFYLDSVRNELKPDKDYDYFVACVAKVAYEIMNERKNNYFRARAQIYQLIADLIDNVEYIVYSNIQPVEEEMELIMRFFDYVKDHLHSDDAGIMATKELGVSQRTMQRYLKKYVGLSIKEVLNMQRLTTAKRLLQDTNKTLDYIIDQCSFSSEKTFYRLFKKDTSMTPTEFRNKASEMRVNLKEQGYLAFDQQETLRLLKNILEV